MTEFISNLIGNNYLATVIMSAFPLIELKGGIVYARDSGLGFFTSLGLAFLGSTIIFFIVYWLLVPILNLLKKIKWFNGFANKCENFIKNKSEKMYETRKAKGKSSLSETRIKQMCLFIFVAIPLPITGVWMGTAIAVFLGLKFTQAILPIAIGNAVAGILISLLAMLLKGYLDIVLYGILGLAIILLIGTIIKVVLTKPKQQ